MKTKYLLREDNAGQDCPLARIPTSFPRRIDESLRLGLDIGIGSIGQAAVRLDADSAPIVFLGVRAFDTPEKREEAGLKLKNPERRRIKQLRRTTRRRSQRLRDLRNLLVAERLLPDDYDAHKHPWTKKHEKADPLRWRVEGLDRLLEPWEWAVCLLHIAKHRGFKSGRKGDLDTESGGKEGGTLQSTRANHDRLAAYRSVAEMQLRDPAFAERKRNREGVYTSTVLRDDLLHEVGLLFESQRRHSNPAASFGLEERYSDIFLRQRRLQNPVDLLGECPFEKGEKRGPRLAPSFELFRSLQRLNQLTLLHADGTRQLLSEWRGADSHRFASEFGRTQKITWRRLREIFAIPEDTSFPDLPRMKSEDSTPAAHDAAAIQTARRKAEGEDFVTRSNAMSSAHGSNLLRKTLGEDLWAELSQPEKVESLDNAAFCLSFYENIEDQPGQEGILGSMGRMAVDERVISAVKADLESPSPSLHRFKGAVGISTKACRSLAREMLAGLRYDQACEASGYRHTDENYPLSSIRNPVVQSVIRETCKQIVHLVDHLGAIPGTICVELARDMGKSVEERTQIERELAKRTGHKNANRQSLAEHLGRSTDQVSGDELLRYELWLEQSGLCPYSGQKLPAPSALSGSQVEIDHVLPRSRSHDNSYDNKVLVYADANRDKKNRTPAEWLGAAGNTVAWRQFTKRIAMMPSLRRRKRRGLLDTSFAEREQEMASRHLNDTRYICRLVGAYLKDLYRLAGEDPDAKGSTRRIFFQPGPLTALVRRAWGLENLKKDISGNRLGDKHHAVDALVCACLTEGQRQWITRTSQRGKDAAAADPIAALEQAYARLEMNDTHRSTPPQLAAPLPWQDRGTFRSDVVAALDAMNVSRRESRKGRGAMHDDTFYRAVKADNGETRLYLRRSLIGLVNGKPKPLVATREAILSIKDIDLPVNAWLKDALLGWLERGCPVDDPPRGPTPACPGAADHAKGPVIRKVTMLSKAKSFRRLRHGHVIKGDQVRVDVFCKASSKGSNKFYFVPIYSHHLSHPHPPMGAITAHKPESEWDRIDQSFDFLFSLWPNSIFEVRKKPSARKPSGEHLLGYYRGIDRDSGRVEGRALNDSEQISNFSAKEGCLLFRKWCIDRLGRLHVVRGEKRTWRGGVCT